MECLYFVSYMSLCQQKFCICRNSIGKSLMQSDDDRILTNHIIDGYLVGHRRFVYRYSQSGIPICCNSYTLGLFGFGHCCVHGSVETTRLSILIYNLIVRLRCGNM